MILLNTQANVFERLRPPPDVVLAAGYTTVTHAHDLNLAEFGFIQPELQGVFAGVEMPLDARPLVFRQYISLWCRTDIGRMLPAVGQPVGVAVIVVVEPSVIVAHEMVIAPVDAAAILHRSAVGCARLRTRRAISFDKGKVAAQAVLAAEVDHHAAIHGFAQFGITLEAMD